MVLKNEGDGKTFSDDIDFKHIDGVFKTSQKEANDQAWYKSHIKFVVSSSNLYGNALFDKRSTLLNDCYYDQLNAASLVDYFDEGYKSMLGMVGFRKNKELLHRDILSPKIKVIEGMEMRQQDPRNIIAVNPQATTRREKKKNEALFESVKAEVMKDVLIQQEQEMAAAEKGGDLNPDEKAKIQQEIQKKTEENTPAEIEKYFARSYKLPEEVRANQLATAIKKFNRWELLQSTGFRNGLIHGYEIYLPYISGNKVKIESIPPENFWSESHSSSSLVADASKQVARYYFSIPEVVNRFRLNKKEIGLLKEKISANDRSHLNFQFSGNERNQFNGDLNQVTCYHAVWKAIVKIGFLTYMDLETGEVKKAKVNDEYKINTSAGDVNITWEYIFMPFEGWSIGDTIFKDMKMSEASLLDSENVWSGSMPYVGVIYDRSYNGAATSLMHRGLSYQLMYDVFYTKLQQLTKSDKGKKLFFDVNSVSKKLGTKKFLHYLDTEDYGLLNPNEEGNKGIDVTNAVKVVDLSLSSDIQKYIMLLEFVDTSCGDTMGVNKQMEGSIGSNEAVFNTKQNITQSSHIIEPLRMLHNIAEDILIERSIELYKVIIRNMDPEEDFHISLVMDDMSIQSVMVDKDMITDNNFGVFSSRSGRSREIFEALLQLSHAAMQTQSADFSDVAKILRSTNIYEAEEILEDAERRKAKEAQQAQEQQSQMAEQNEEKQRAFRREEMDHEAKMIVLKEEEKRKTFLQSQTIESMGFADNKDADADGIPDVFEVFKHGVDADLKGRTLDIESVKSEHEMKIEDEKIELEKEKLKIEREKIHSKN